MEITQERLNRLLAYSPETGELTWKHRGPEDFVPGEHSSERKCAAWNARHEGKKAFVVKNRDGYNTGTLYGRGYKAARIIWFMMYGYWPKEIDHIDRNPANDSLKNLREADRTLNLINRGRFRSSGRKHRNIIHTKTSKWEVVFTTAGRRRYIGTFDSEDEALSARDSFLRAA